MSDVRKVGTYVVLAASRLTQPLTLPSYTSPINGEVVPAFDFTGGLPLGEVVSHTESVDGTLTRFGGEWTAHQMFALSMLSHADGTGGKVLTHSEALALQATPEWLRESEE